MSIKEIIKVPNPFLKITAKPVIDIDKNIIIEKKRIRPKNSEVDKLICDNKKIRKSSLWKPKINIEKGIENTVNWIKQNQEIFKSNTYNV